MHTPALLERLTAPVASRIFRHRIEADQLCRAEIGWRVGLAGRSLFARRLVLAAGAGNGPLIEGLGLGKPAMQLRPLHQVIARHPSGAVIVFDSAGKPYQGPMTSYVGEEWASGLNMADLESLDVNGLEAATGSGRLNRNGGTVVCVGAPPIDEAITINPAAAFTVSEKKLMGCTLGSSNSLREIPRLVALWQAGKLDLEALITARRPLAEINEAMQSLREAQGVRTVTGIPAGQPQGAAGRPRRLIEPAPAALRRIADGRETQRCSQPAVVRCHVGVPDPRPARDPHGLLESRDGGPGLVPRQQVDAMRLKDLRRRLGVEAAALDLPLDHLAGQPSARGLGPDVDSQTRGLDVTELEAALAAFPKTESTYRMPDVGTRRFGGVEIGPPVAESAGRD